MNSFEKGRRRAPVSLLPVIVQTLHTTLNAPVDEGTPPPPAQFAANHRQQQEAKAKSKIEAPMQ